MADTCSSCGGSLQGSRGKEVAALSENGSGKSLCVPLRNGGRGDGADNMCKSCHVGTEGESEVSVGVTVSSKANCGCGPRNRRRSTSGILDEEGKALLQILEFPSKVSMAVVIIVKSRVDVGLKMEVEPLTVINN